MENNIRQIINRLSVILAHSDKTPTNIIGGYIVGATIVRDDIDKYNKKYPLLEVIGELGAELETIKDADYAKRLLERIKIRFNALKDRVLGNKINHRYENAGKQDIEKLKKYVLENINKLAKQDAMFIELKNLAYKLVLVSNKSVALINKETAEKYSNYSPDDYIGTPFSNEEVNNFHKIGLKILEIATDPKSDNENLTQVANYLYPLFSQDRRTIDMGYDLTEYMDWYFYKTTKNERIKYVKELTDGWYINSNKN